MTGTLHNEYTGTTITLKHGPDTTAIQANHVVALGDAWQTGACHWSSSKRESFAIDVAGLRAVDTRDNEVKSDKDAAQWLPRRTVPGTSRPRSTSRRSTVWASPPQSGPP